MSDLAVLETNANQSPLKRRQVRSIDPGEHVAIIDASLRDEVRHVIANNRSRRADVALEPSPALLRGLIFTEIGVAMTPHSCSSTGHSETLVSMRKGGLGNAALTSGCLKIPFPLRLFGPLPRNDSIARSNNKLARYEQSVSVW